MEPIAVCGLALKFPGDASSVEEFWKMLCEKRNAMKEFPSDRLNINAFHHPNRNNSLCMRGAHFIDDDIGLFDADFFSITPSTAAAMDPMQRILLETTFHAFESGGIRLEDIRGSRTSVHTGCFTNDYLQQILKDSERLPPYAAIGATQSMLANRLSWFFDLRGPSMNIDTACSSSAVAVDLACQLLRSGTTDMGVVGGCNILLDPDFSIVLSDMHMLSPDSRCYAFDQRANGYGRGEGIGVIILKRLKDALHDNDTIRAVIRASGTSQDGRTPGITQPDTKAQADLIRHTYNSAGLDMSYTRYFEAHGTGTEIGDPTEVNAIADCFQPYRDAAKPLYVGSVKANIGHLEGASGLAGLIKTILVVESGIIPPNSNLQTINRKLAAYGHVISLPTQCVQWPACRIRRASVNSFGYGGTNCHIVLDNANSYLNGERRISQGNHSKCFEPHKAVRHEELDKIAKSNMPKLLVWSASSETAAQTMISAWETYLSRKAGLELLSNVSYTLGTRRSFLSSRSFAVISDTKQLQQISKISSKPMTASESAPSMAFVFTGQGAQWYAMGRELFVYPKFLETILQANLIFRKLGCSWSVIDEILKPEADSKMDNPSISQSLTTVVQMGLVDLFESFGIKPVAVVGHSMGEIAAAYCAGHLNRESALKISYYRGYFTSTICEQSSYQGSMLAVALPAEELSVYIEQINCKLQLCDGRLVISCVNSPNNTTVAGETSRIKQLQELLDAQGIFARQLRVPVAYHSPQMLQIVTNCLHSFGSLKPSESASDIHMISSVTGSILTRKRSCEASYWVENIISPVLFTSAIERLCRDTISSIRKKLDGSHRERFAVDHIIEIGPHAALRLPIQETLATLMNGNRIRYNSALIRRHSACLTVLQLLGELFCHGLPIKLHEVNDPRRSPDEPRRCLSDAPLYPFDHSKSYWSESPLVRNYRLREHGYTALLGSPSKDWNPLEPQWRCCVDISDMPWLLEHQLNGKSIYPAAAFIVMAIEGVSQITGNHGQIHSFTLEDVHFKSAISVSPEMKDLETRLCLKPALKGDRRHSDLWSFSIYSVNAAHWTEACYGTIRSHLKPKTCMEEEAQKAVHYVNEFQVRKRDCCIEYHSSKIYSNFIKHGFQYGPAFQKIVQVHHDGSVMVTANINLTGSSRHQNPKDQFSIHPGTLDSFFQIALVALSKVDGYIATQAVSKIDRLWISAEGLKASHRGVHATARVESETSRKKLYSVYALSNDEKSVEMIIDGLETTVVSTHGETDAEDINRQYWYTISTDVDIDSLSSPKLTQHLESICGPDAQGPGGFFRDLRPYLLTRISQILASLQHDSVDSSKPYLQRYVKWMQWQLDIAVRGPTMSEQETRRQRIGQHSLLGELFLQVSDHALEILQGGSDIMQLLFENDHVEKFYEQLLENSLCSRKLRTYLKSYSFQHPGLKILEVGAGTGSFTDHVLQAITPGGRCTQPWFEKYTFTDISPVFFERTTNRFAQWAQKMEFSVLDVDQDPTKQGYSECAFDIIIASDVLHITQSIERTLRNLRKLLKPGGKLIVHEHTQPESIEVGFVFGLLPGWWPDSRGDRTMSPLYKEEQWDMIMKQTGFSGTDAVLRDFSDEESHLMSIMITTAVETDSNAALPAITFAIESSSRRQSQAAEHLSASLISAGFPESYVVDLATWRKDLTYPKVVIALFDLDDAVLARLNEETFETLKHLLLTSSKILWVSKGGGHGSDPRYGMIDGFTKVFRVENMNIPISTLALDFEKEITSCSFGLVVSAAKRLVTARGSQHIDNFVVYDGILHVNRIYDDPQFETEMLEIISGEKQAMCTVKSARPFKVISDHSYGVKSIHAIQEVHPEQLGSDDIEIEIRAIDCSPDTINGRGCAGFVLRASRCSAFLPGDRVCAYGTGIVNSTASFKSRLTSKIPATLTFEEASILPQELLLADYLVNEVKAGSHNVVVVRGGHTRFGSATIFRLEPIHSSLFVTVPTMQDLAMHRSVFGHVQASTYGLFAEQFGLAFPHGANIVLDFDSTDGNELTTRLMKFGRVIKVRPNIGETRSSFQAYDPTITYQTVDLPHILRYKSERLRMPQAISHSMIQRHYGPVQTIKLSNGNAVHTLVKTLQPEQRIAMVYDDDDQINVCSSRKRLPLFDPSASYLIAGGFGDLGRCLATWMASRGARNLIIISRTGPQAKSATEMVQCLEAQGVHVYAPQCDIACKASLESALHGCQNMPAIKGCIQASGALKDVLFERMRFPDWETSIQSKVRGSWNLHELLPENMDFFVLTSSVSGILGQATQINYASGNSYQDALARYRLSLGEKAVSLDLGILSVGGMVSQTKGLLEKLVAEGTYSPLSEPEILALFEYACNPRRNLQDTPAQIVSGIVSPARQVKPSGSSHPAFSHPFWSQILGDNNVQSGSRPKAIETANVQSALSQVQSLVEASEIIVNALVDRFCSIALTPREKINLDEPLHKAGADSLSAVYLRNWILKQVGVNVTVFDILGDKSVTTLGFDIAKEWYDAHCRS